MKMRDTETNRQKHNENEQRMREKRKSERFERHVIKVGLAGDALLTRIRSSTIAYGLVVLMKTYYLDLAGFSIQNVPLSIHTRT